MAKVRTCVFCDAKVAGWTTTYFFGGNKKYCDASQCVCEVCAEKHLEYNKQYGDYDLKKGRAIPPAVNPFS